MVKSLNGIMLKNFRYKNVNMIITTEHEDNFLVEYKREDTSKLIEVFVRENEAEARGQMLLYLIKNKLIK